jgi:COP9 signalosome complex subunit 3
VPSTVSQASSRAFKHLARPYEEFSQALRNPDTLHDCLRTHETVFGHDKNLGLVSQVMERQEMRAIAALKETYVTISLEDIASKVCGSKSSVSPEDIQRMELLILQMVI